MGTKKKWYTLVKRILPFVFEEYDLRTVSSPEKADAKAREDPHCIGYDLYIQEWKNGKGRPVYTERLLKRVMFGKKYTIDEIRQKGGDQLARELEAEGLSYGVYSRVGSWHHPEKNVEVVEI